MADGQNATSGIEPIPKHRTDDSSDGATESGPGPTVKTVQLLGLLAEQPQGMGVRAIGRQLALPVSTVHRLLGVLEGVGMVSQDATTRQYAIGVEFYRIAALVSREAKLPTLARPILQRLAAEVNETALLCLHLESQGQMMFVDRVDGTQALRYHVDLLRPLSLLWGASGKAILAFLEPDVVETIRQNAGPSPGTGKSVPSRAALDEDLAVIRRDHYALTESEKLPGGRGVASPVFGPGGVEGCICITSPADRLPSVAVREVANRVVDEARHLTMLYAGQLPNFDESGMVT